MHRATSMCTCGRPQPVSCIQPETVQSEFPPLFTTATDSIASGTTDDTGIESSSLGASPTLPSAPHLSRMCPETRSELCTLSPARVIRKNEPCHLGKPPPIPPKLERGNPPLPPKHLPGCAEKASESIKCHGGACTQYIYEQGANFEGSSTVFRPYSPPARLSWKRESTTSHGVYNSGSPPTDPLPSKLPQTHTNVSVNPTVGRFSRVSSPILRSPHTSQLPRPDNPAFETQKAHEFGAGRATGGREGLSSQVLLSPPCSYRMNKRWDGGMRPSLPHLQSNIAKRATIPSGQTIIRGDHHASYIESPALAHQTDALTKSGCGGLQWLSNRLIRFFRSSSISRRRGRKCSPIDRSGLWHERSKSYNSPQTSKSTAFRPHGRSSSPSCHSPCHSSSSAVMQPLNRHVLSPPIPALFDRDVLTELMPSSPTFFKASRSAQQIAEKSGRCHPLPPRTANTPPPLPRHRTTGANSGSIHGCSRAPCALHSNLSNPPNSTSTSSDQFRVRRSLISSVINQTSTNGSLDRMQSTECRLCRSLRSCTNRPYFKPFQAASLRLSSTSLITSPENDRADHTTVQVLPSTSNPGVPTTLFLQSENEICESDQSPFVDKNGQIHHIHHIYHVHHFYHHHHHVHERLDAAPDAFASCPLSPLTGHVNSALPVRPSTTTPSSSSILASDSAVGATETAGHDQPSNQNTPDPQRVKVVGSCHTYSAYDTNISNPGSIGECSTWCRSCQQRVCSPPPPSSGSLQPILESSSLCPSAGEPGDGTGVRPNSTPVPSPVSASTSGTLHDHPCSNTHLARISAEPEPSPSCTLPVSSVTTTSSSHRCSRTRVPSSNDLQDSRSSFQRSMLELRKMGWYWGPLTFQQAQMLLAKRPDGTFLVRDSGHDTYILSLSFRVRGETYHTRIEHNQGRFSFWSQPQSHSASTMVEFIEKAVAHSISGQFHYFLQTSAQGQPPVEVPLLYPLSRFQVVSSLRHLTRFVILSRVRRDHIDQLPLPPMLLSFLMEKQYYVESLEAFEEAIRDRPALEFHPRHSANTSDSPSAGNANGRRSAGLRQNGSRRSNNSSSASNESGGSQATLRASTQTSPAVDAV
ncbi:unnamed protein product [Calicophoron daubneyi]|uniref:Suppressor of cytokine signaling 7 n=1 Tax=Calicophoron daubneyi TaxID=300641 RepID=A0AAV2SZC9_CALDB